MYNLQYQVVAASNYLPFFKLKTTSNGILNWQSTPHAATPIQLVLKLKQLAYLLKISICSLGGSPIKQIQVWTSHAENYAQAPFEQVAKILDVSGMDMPVSVNKICRLVKLVIKEKKEGKSIGIESIKLAGDFSLANTNNKEIQLPRVDKLLLELGISSGDGDYEKDLEAMDIDQETKTTIREMMAQQSTLLEQENYDELESLRADIKEVVKIGTKIIQAQRNFDWASAKQNYKDMRIYSEELQRLRRKRDRYDKIYETSRFEKMIEIEEDSTQHDKIYAKMLAEDQQIKNQNKQKQDDEMNFKRMLIHNEYQQIRNQNPPWWEKDAPFLDDVEIEKSRITQQNKPPKPKPKKDKPKVEEEPEKIKKVQSKMTKQQSNADKYDFSNPYVFNQGDADLERYMSKEFSSAAMNPDNTILRKYEQLEFLKILGSKVWLSIHDKNWRQRQSAAQSVMDYIQSQLPERYRDGNTVKLYEALLEFAWICCHDKVLTIYMLGLKILATCLRPPICSKKITPQMINKSIKDFAPILLEKIQQSNSKAKEVSQSTLISVCKHPLANPNVLYKQILKGLRQQVYNGKIITADKLPARVISARMEMSLALLSEVDVKAHNINVKEMFNLLAGPALLHSNYEVRITAIELVGELYRFIGQPLLKMVVDLHELRPGISEMVITRLKKIKLVDNQQ